jgi:AcrR family transcriptional regulator
VTDAQVRGTARRTSGHRGRPRSGVREAVLAAAEAIVSESGAARLATREVARRAGVAESSVFYHFGDRLGLLRAVIEERVRPYRDVADRVREQAGQGTLRGNLIALTEALEDLFLTVIPFLAAVEADAELRALFTQSRQESGAGPHRALDPVADYLAAEHAAGRLRPGTDVRAAALLLVGAAHQRAMLRRLGDSPGSGLPGIDQVVDTVLPGLSVQGHSHAPRASAAGPAAAGG